MALLGDDDIDAAPGKVHRQRGADRPAADDQHARCDAPWHQGGQITFTSACCPPRTAAAARRNAAGRSAGPLDTLAMAVMRRDDLLEVRCRQIGEQASIALAPRRHSPIHVQRRPPHRAVQRVVVDHRQHRQVLHLRDVVARGGIGEHVGAVAQHRQHLTLPAPPAWRRARRRSPSRGRRRRSPPNRLPGVSSGQYSWRNEYSLITIVSRSTTSRRQWFSQANVFLLPRPGPLGLIAPLRVQFRASARPAARGAHRHARRRGPAAPAPAPPAPTARWR